MKIDLSRDEIWALIGTLDGVWEDEKSDVQRSAGMKLERAYRRPAAPSTDEGEAPC